MQCKKTEHKKQRGSIYPTIIIVCMILMTIVAMKVFLFLSLSSLISSCFVCCNVQCNSVEKYDGSLHSSLDERDPEVY